METEAYLSFWGKAGGELNEEPSTHPLAYHSLDVAACADALLLAHPRTLAKVAGLLGTSSDNARRCIVALIALHDIGKFADAFQWKVPAAWPRGVLGDDWRFGGGRHHTIVALDLFNRLELNALFAPAFDADRWDDGLLRLWEGIACHHGKPAQPSHDLESCMRSNAETAAKAFAADVASFFGRYKPFAPIAKGDLRTEALSWLIAGLTNLADWIGSNRESFPYCAPDRSHKEYWTYARQRAETAIASAGILPAPTDFAVQFSTLFPQLSDPSPLQSWAQSVELPAGPVLAIIEDVTGSGKTEAALVLAARLMAGDRAGGLFFALPTMATANAMFERLGESYRRMFDHTACPSLVLAHGRRQLHAGFTDSILKCLENEDEHEADSHGDGSSAACAAWIADDRRKAFLAHIGVGTIDQAFLSVLPSKHQALRLWGLADRVLIVDEAHAYDAYMGRELERLLEFQSALGGSAIVLSATLPDTQRTGLAKAFARGLGSPSQAASEIAYPLATLVSANSSTAEPVNTRADRTRRLPVRLMMPGDEPLAHVVEMARRGAAVAWIRNAVDDAIEAAEALRANQLEPVLLHARFAMGDRLSIEARVRETLGKDGSADGRRGFVVVGTQILEQSLDYDVDVMVTDLAPVDLIIQRAGRLWRHDERTKQGRPVSSPELVVVAPDWRVVEDSNWYRQVSARAAAVYKHHGAIWRTARVLEQMGAIETPGGVRSLIESVYARDDQQNDDVPQNLQRASNEARGQHQAQVSIAESNLLNVRKGYGGNNLNWTSDTLTPTRLGDPTTAFRLGRIQGGEVVPWCRAGDGDIRRSWSLSEVSLRRRKAASVPKHDAQVEAMIERAKTSWPEWEREQPLLVFHGDLEAASGVILDQSGKSHPVIYGRTTSGLRIV
jgi:CRISPR-associated endonuclease/helicase Cas3